MKLSFLPGNLHLTKEQDGTYLVTMQGQELLRTRVEKKAVAKFNAARKDLESQFPARELTPEEKRAALEKLLPPKKEKITGTRTFG
jgi:regulatory protein YycH of two-component signal transduction system YycFG